MMPCHHALAEALHAYIDAAGIAARLFCSAQRAAHDGTTLSDQPMTQVDAWRMVRKRALAAGIMAADWQPFIPRNRDHGVSRQWRHAGTRTIDGCARKSAHDQAL